MNINTSIVFVISIWMNVNGPASESAYIWAAEFIQYTCVNPEIEKWTDGGTCAHKVLYYYRFIFYLFKNVHLFYLFIFQSQNFFAVKYNLFPSSQCTFYYLINFSNLIQNKTCILLWFSIFLLLKSKSCLLKVVDIL